MTQIETYAEINTFSGNWRPSEWQGDACWGFTYYTHPTPHNPKLSSLFSFRITRLGFCPNVHLELWFILRPFAPNSGWLSSPAGLSHCDSDAYSSDNSDSMPLQGSHVPSGLLIGGFIVLIKRLLWFVTVHFENRVSGAKIVTAWDTCRIHPPTH